jgi:transcription antitermination factor NusG
MESQHSECWYAIRVRTGYESLAARALDWKNIKRLLPMSTEVRLWGKRRQKLQLPAFPGYLFAQFGMPRKLDVLTSPGVMSIVGFGGTPAPISQCEIDSIKTIVTAGAEVTAEPFLAAGDRVEVVAGALCGLRGFLLAVKGKTRVVISVSLLQRSVAIEIDPALLRRLGKAQQHTADCLGRKIASIALALLPLIKWISSSASTC